MAPEKAPAFQMYADQFLTDENQVVMSLEQVGAYARLMCYCWREITIPDDPAKLARMVGTTPARMKKLWPGIRVCFCPDSSGEKRLRHARLDVERAKQQEWRETQSENGKRGAEKRWGRHGEPNGVGMGSPQNGDGENMPLQSPSPTPVQIPSGSDQRFAQFWAAYPLKVGKKPAAKAFRKLHVSDALLEIMLAAIAVQRASERWRKNDGQYIPNPATWLNAARWEDEVPQSACERWAAEPPPSSQAYVCLHEPKCGAYAQHKERLEWEAVKAQRAEVA